MTPQERILQNAQRLSRENDWQGHVAQGCIKRMLAAVWNELPLEDREAFTGQLHPETLELITMSSRLAYLKGFPEIYQALVHWRRVKECAPAELQGFASSIDAKISKGGFMPSDKQASIMLKIYSEWKLRGTDLDLPDDLDVLEDAE